MRQSPTALLLLSGGYDSPVSGKVLKDKGFKVAGIHFSQEPFTDSQPEIKATQLAKKLEFNPLYIVNIGEQLLEISQKCNPKNYFIHMKRLMYRIASRIATDKKFDFLVTGESLGQVSSQTLHNLQCLTDALTEIPILRPLIWLEKHEIIDLNKKMECYDISSGPESCDRLGPRYPETHAIITKIHLDEENIDVENMITTALGKTRRIDVKTQVTSSDIQIIRS